jgi:hypothetical protein
MMLVFIYIGMVIFNMRGMKDCLIIRNKIDWVTDFTNWMGEGLKEEMERRGLSVVDLSGTAATPENVSYWLKSSNRRISKMVIDFDHGYPDKLVGERNGEEATIIDKQNAGDFTHDLDVYTFACSTGVRGGLGETAVKNGCRSWLGYTDTIWYDPFIASTFKKSMWSYILAMADGKPAEYCYQLLVHEYKKLAEESMISEWDLTKLVLIGQK